MKLVPTEAANLVRDIDSKAILVTDEIARTEFKKKQQRHKAEINKLYYEIQELRNTVDDINKIKDEISEIKCLLSMICNNKGQ